MPWPGVARTVGNIGELLFRHGDLARAKARFLEQLAIGRQIPEDKQRGYALQGLGTVLLAEGDLNGARSKLEEALDVRFRMGAKGLAAESRAALAQVALEEGNSANAEALAREAAQEFQSENETDQEAWAHSVPARSLIAQGRLGRARRIVDFVKTRLSRIDDAAIRVSAGISIARALASLGNTDEARRRLLRTRAEAANAGYAVLDFEADWR